MPWFKDEARKYSIIIDAGSSGSRVQIYTWLENKVTRQAEDDVLPRIERQADEGKIEPGLSSIDTDPEAVDDYFKPLIHFMEQAVPKRAWSKTPVYLLGTAGLRLLPDEKREALLESACDTFLRKTHFVIEDCSSHFQVISGKDEGLYGWVAMNYLMGGLGPIENRVTSASSRRRQGMYGFLDMGGASTQIAFEPAEQEIMQHKDDLVHISLQSRSGVQHDHYVFVATWLGFGTTQARERFVDALISQENRKRPANDQIDDHVHEHHHEGVDLDVQNDIEFTNEPISTVLMDPCLHPGLYVSELRYPGVTLKGTGDFTQCLKKTKPLLRKSKHCPEEPCLFDGTHVPPIHFESTPFVGVADYWHATNDLWSLGGAHDAARYESYAKAFCSQDWTTVAIPNGEVHPDLPRLETQCFRAAWIINVLHEGIGIPRVPVDPESNVTPHFQSLSGVDQTTLSWTLGRIALDVAAPHPHAIIGSGSSSYLFILVLIIGGYIGYLWKRKNDSRTPSSTFLPMDYLNKTDQSLDLVSEEVPGAAVAPKPTQPSHLSTRPVAPPPPASSIPPPKGNASSFGPLPLPLEAQLPANPVSAMNRDRFIQGWNDMPVGVTSSSSRASRRNVRPVKNM